MGPPAPGLGAPASAAPAPGTGLGTDGPVHEACLQGAGHQSLGAEAGQAPGVLSPLLPGLLVSRAGGGGQTGGCVAAALQSTVRVWGGAGIPPSPWFHILLTAPPFPESTDCPGWGAEGHQPTFPYGRYLPAGGAHLECSLASPGGTGGCWVVAWHAPGGQEVSAVSGAPSDSDLLAEPQLFSSRPAGRGDPATGQGRRGVCEQAGAGPGRALLATAGSVLGEGWGHTEGHGLTTAPLGAQGRMSCASGYCKWQAASSFHGGHAWHPPLQIRALVLGLRSPPRPQGGGWGLGGQTVALGVTD